MNSSDEQTVPEGALADPAAPDPLAPDPAVQEQAGKPEAGGLVWFWARFQRHSGELARLAVPVVASRAGILTLALADTIMLGPLGAAEVGRYGLGTSSFVFLLVVGIGLLFGTMVQTSHLRGEGRLEETGSVWRRALPYAALLSALGIGLTQFAEAYFLLVGQSPELAASAASVTMIQGVGLLPMLFYVTSNMYLEAMGRPLPGMIAVWGANIVNIGLNIWLIEGGLGVSGADGAALATTICRFGMMIGVMAYVWHLGGREAFGIRVRPQPGWIRGGREARRHGYAAGPAYAAESGAFHVMHIFAGWMIAEELASFAVNMNLLSMVFMISLGIASATAVRVGVAHGRRDWADRALAGWTGCFWVIAVLTPIAILLFLIPEESMALLYQIQDPDLLRVMAPATALVGLAMTLDGGQFTLGNALRGASDAWIPTVLNFIGFILVMIPAAYWLGVEMDRGARGLYEGVLFASAVVFTILALRWSWVCLRARSA